MLTFEQAKKWYPQDDPVHDINHILRVYRMAEHLAVAEGGDVDIVRAAALLHDAQGSAPEDANNGENRQDHHLSSATFAEKILLERGWSKERILAVQHCIRAHRYRSTETPDTLEAKILFDADKLDVLGAIGAARTIAYAALAKQPIYAEPSTRFLENGEKEPGEAHTAYHEYLFKLRNVKDRMFTTTGKALAEARHEYLTEFFAQLAAETRGER